MAMALSPAARLEAWDRGATLHPVDRAMLLLSLADPAETAALPQLSLGEHDRRLLDARRTAYGDRMPCLVDCPACGEAQEFELSAAALMAGLAPPPALEPLEAEGWRIGLRALESGDLARASRERTPEGAAAALVACAIASVADPDGHAADAPPAVLWPAIEARVQAREAAAETALDLACVACGHGWTAGFDIGAYLWAEVEADARRLLGEIALLAARFGWSEERLLAMSPARRRAYLDLAGAA